MTDKEIIIKGNNEPKNPGEVSHWDMDYKNPNRTYRYVFGQYYALEKEAQELLDGKRETLSAIYLFTLHDLPKPTRFIEEKNDCKSKSHLISILCEEIKNNEIRKN